jgi:hypothetical protein
MPDNVAEQHCQFPSERGDGALCGHQVESIVDVVRDNGDGSSTFFVLPMCLGHRLALGEFVITFQPVSDNGKEARRG